MDMTTAHDKCATPLPRMREQDKLDRDMCQHLLNENCILALRAQQIENELLARQRRLQDVVLSI